MMAANVISTADPACPGHSAEVRRGGLPHVAGPGFSRDAYRPGPEDHDGVVRIHTRRDDRRPDVGVRDADIFRLPPVVTARCVRIAEDAADRRGLRVGLVAVPIQSLPAKEAFPAYSSGACTRSGKNRIQLNRLLSYPWQPSPPPSH